MAITANLSYQPGASMANRKDIFTASIYPLPEEWERFQKVAAQESRREAAQLVELAKKAAEHPESFRLLSRPRNGVQRQVKTAKANPYLKILADALDPTGERKDVTLSAVAETLVRMLSMQ